MSCRKNLFKACKSLLHESSVPLSCPSSWRYLPLPCSLNSHLLAIVPQSRQTPHVNTSESRISKSQTQRLVQILMWDSCCILTTTVADSLDPMAKGSKITLNVSTWSGFGVWILAQAYIGHIQRSLIGQTHIWTHELCPLLHFPEPSSQSAQISLTFNFPCPQISSISTTNQAKYHATLRPPLTTTHPMRSIDRVNAQIIFPE